MSHVISIESVKLKVLLIGGGTIAATLMEMTSKAVMIDEWDAL